MYVLWAIVHVYCMLPQFGQHGQDGQHVARRAIGVQGIDRDSVEPCKTTKLGPALGLISNPSIAMQRHVMKTVPTYMFLV